MHGGQAACTARKRRSMETHHTYKVLHSLFKREINVVTTYISYSDPSLWSCRVVRRSGIGAFNFDGTDGHLDAKGFVDSVGRGC
jgi:hypothetical protein